MNSPHITISLDTSHDRFRITGGTYMHRDRIASIPGSRFVGGGADYWTIPRSWPGVKALSRLFGEALDWAQDAADWANQTWESLIEPSLHLRNVGANPEWVGAVASTLPEGILTMDYQIAGAFFLATAKRAALFDEQGTGKMTQTALTLSLYPDTFPCLIVCPKGVVYTWQRELAKFSIESTVIDGGKTEREKQFESFQTGSSQVLIISYHLMPKHSRVAGFGTIKLSDEHRAHKELQQTAWRTVVADECHRMKEPDTVWTRAVWACREKAEYVWGLTGTPIEENIMDMWSLLHYIAPLEFPGKSKFMDMYVLTVPQFFGGIEILGMRPDTAQEFRDITEWHWRRVLKGDDLPPEQFDTRFAFMPAKYTKVYKDMKKQLMAEVDSDGSYDTLFAENHMVKTGRLFMMASSAVAIDAEDNVRMTEPSWKLDEVEDTMVDYPYPSIFWFVNRDLLHMFEARLAKKEIPFVSIHGDVSARDRTDNIEAFQSGKVDHILLTYGAGSEGTTLTRAPVAHRVQRPWSSIQDQQAPARNRRIGSEIHEHITYVDYIVRGTVDEEVAQRQIDKKEAQQEVLKDGIL